MLIFGFVSERRSLHVILDVLSDSPTGMSWLFASGRCIWFESTVRPSNIRRLGSGPTCLRASCGRTKCLVMYKTPGGTCTSYQTGQMSNGCHVGITLKRRQFQLLTPIHEFSPMFNQENVLSNIQTDSLLLSASRSAQSHNVSPMFERLARLLILAAWLSERWSSVSKVDEILVHGIRSLPNLNLHTTAQHGNTHGGK